MKLAIIGASGHGKVVADIAEKNGYDDIEFYDDDKYLTYCGKWPVVGSTDEVPSDEGYPVFVAIGNNKIRRKYIEKYADKNLITLIHPDATVAEAVSIGKGSLIVAGSVINSGTKLGTGCIVNTSSSVDHDCTIGNYCHLSPGTHICGTVEIGDGTWLGAGSIVVNNTCICDECIIGAGAVVVDKITVPGIYIGLPARLLRK